MANPNVIVLAGPNGAGKSTAAPVLLRGELAVSEFVNADVIARGLSGFNPQSVALEAGKIMLRRLKHLAGQRADFAFETTLASRSFSPWLRELSVAGYHVHLVFLWLASPELALRRVASRVRAGGHHVSEGVVLRRYEAGLKNFFELYKPIAFSWAFYDNSEDERCVIASFDGRAESVEQPALWLSIKGRYENAK